jgi:predicted AAA+ superfamily ATPase
MIQRICNVSKKHSFFLFGPRGTGKSTYFDEWSRDKSVFRVDLLDPVQSQRYVLRPELLISDWESQKTDWIFVDEIQKIPPLLDAIQMQMKKKNVLFALTGSSARKLRRGAANLLGGRAHEFHMHPLTCFELENSDLGFHLDQVLAYGSLPHIVLDAAEDRVRSLYTYVTTYLREEILIEQVIRKIEPFQKFLEVAAQMSGQILNFAKIARDSGVEERSVARYFQILDDTLVGFFLHPFDRSIRRQQSQKAKFYFFDTGITRTLQNQVTQPLVSGTNLYGDLFEQFVILECLRLNDYYEKHFQFHYFRSKDVEVDLIVSRPGLPSVLIEIKSRKTFSEDDCDNLLKVANEFPKSELFVFSNCPQNTVYRGVRYIHWHAGLKELFLH